MSDIDIEIGNKVDCTMLGPKLWRLSEPGDSLAQRYVGTVVAINPPNIKPRLAVVQVPTAPQRVEIGAAGQSTGDQVEFVRTAPGSFRAVGTGEGTHRGVVTEITPECAVVLVEDPPRTATLAVNVLSFPTRIASEPAVKESSDV